MKTLRLLPLTLLFAACAYREQPIYNPADPIPPAAQGLPLTRIEAMIAQAGVPHGWTMRHIGPGHIEASHTQDKFAAVADITFDATSWRIEYQSSTGLRAEDGHIHSHYNVWIRNLEHDIQTQLSAASR